ncbi:hypothetical protein Droror1_Dr00024980 [Drosera rotundifolia]
MVGKEEDMMVVGRSGGGGRLMGRERSGGDGGNRESVGVVEGVGGSVLVAVVGEGAAVISELFEQQLEEKMRLMEIIDREEKAKELAKLEREKAEAASHTAHKAWESAQKEAYQRKYAQQKAIHKVKYTISLRLQIHHKQILKQNS